MLAELEQYIDQLRGQGPALFNTSGGIPRFNPDYFPPFSLGTGIAGSDLSTSVIAWYNMNAFKNLNTNERSFGLSFGQGLFDSVFDRLAENNGLQNDPEAMKIIDSLKKASNSKFKSYLISLREKYGGIKSSHFGEPVNAPTGAPHKGGTSILDHNLGAGFPVGWRKWRANFKVNINPSSADPAFKLQLDVKF